MLAELETRYDRGIADVHELLGNMPDADMERVVEVYPAFLVWTSNVPTTVRDCLLHAVVHSALHQAHSQLTCQVLTQQNEDYRSTHYDRELEGTPIWCRSNRAETL
jgi:hypothetical protein